MSTAPPLTLYYSQKCVHSNKILQILNSNPNMRAQVKIACVDSFYKKTGKFPNGIRGTPSIFEESDNRVKVYEGKTAMELIKKMTVSRAASLAIEAEKRGDMTQQRPQQQLPQNTLTNNNNNFRETNTGGFSGVNSDKNSGLNLDTAFAHNPEWAGKVGNLDIKPSDAMNPGKFDGVNPFADERFNGKQSANTDVQQKYEQMLRDSPYNVAGKQQTQVTEQQTTYSPYVAPNEHQEDTKKKRDPFTPANKV